MLTLTADRRRLLQIRLFRYRSRLPSVDHLQLRRLRADPLLNTSNLARLQALACATAWTSLGVPSSANISRAPPPDPPRFPQRLDQISCDSGLSLPPSHQS
ncbi:hypothetical protein KSP39_PZI003229 [Platanthera zijinensis]|uniref:Uncharacterized protein n=1 Tax=Platanthera zijinensis TaxID=2320716 RepID=A0AAP0GC03_9ASPA